MYQCNVYFFLEIYKYHYNVLIQISGGGWGDCKNLAIYHLYY